MIYIFETYLYSRFPDDDPRFNSPGNDLIRAGNPNNTKTGDDSIYSKESLAARVLFKIRKVPYDISFHYIDHLVRQRINLMIFCLTLGNFSDITSYNTSLVLKSGDFDARTSS